ncbi:SANT/Myb-like DNA-binding domain-containing protein [Mesorhizobium sp. DCY119]|uniref:SANT/Myb-like DNA-binding domain-containing protein n=1 Tax=Mesorhizobium sp. DCY119 TaxID=2108445 RepID=UPI000E728E97|nr:SANT/Myb-like DNA-binding domain-containing protein [Mesorhizobium sp. DCY119]RJG40770.1 hypothetical protein D3Y55_26410 [Mesorhizobium sp. DCY119]
MGVVWMERDRSKGRWTREELKQLKQLAAKRVDLNVIAKELGRTPSAVRTKATQRAIPLKGTKKIGLV